MTDAAKTMIASIQVSLRSLRLTSHRVSWPVAWMTSSEQNPSQSWKTGEEKRRILSQEPIVRVSSKPSEPRSHSAYE